MRILVVSAHYPPNFVSGGTLVPQRLARAVRAHGHDVSVYAGWLGDDRAPLDAWSGPDESGMPIRWVTVTPWTSWADRHNFDNPGVVADFRAHLAEVRPQVVHFHSLQTMGGELVAAAADAGARVVVTMHDFWWFCGRQFLADRDYRPCCPVVSCSSCPCQVDRAWLAERDATLARWLERADVILAVSKPSMDILRANGVDPSRLRLDEHSFEPTATPSTRPPRAAGAPVRFAYAGGPDRMKGAAIVVSAAQRLAGRHGWELTLYGAGPYLSETGTDLSALPVRVEPPYAPGDLDDVLRGHDVLLVPSVASETFSIITREALVRGVPVICSDTPGPTEVVTDRVNGLVTAAGDPGSLASAMASIVDDPPLLASLQQGCGAVEVRSEDEQTDALVSLYRELVEGPGTAPGAGAGRRAVRHVLFVAGIEGAPLRYRVRLPAEGLALLGVTSEACHYRDPRLAERLDRADAVVLYRVPATMQLLDTLSAARSRRRVPMLFDVDDLIFDPDILGEVSALGSLEADERALYEEGVRRYRTTMEACDAFIGSTEALCRHVEAVVGLPAHRFANGVGALLGAASDAEVRRPRRPGPLRVGYLSGTTTHDDDWRFVEPAVVRVLRDRPEVELWLGGHIRPSTLVDELGPRVRRIPFTPWLELPAVLRDLDVNLAPLEPGSRFNEAKSAIKWLEAALTATPTVATPTQPFVEAIQDRHTGVLATTEAEWADALAWLLDDQTARERIGREARRTALLRWPPHVQGRRYLDILTAGALAPTDRTSSWEATANDEPPAPVELEPYTPPPAGAVAEPPIERAADAPTYGQRLRRLASNGRSSIADAGVAATAVRAGRYARRQAPRVLRAGRRVGHDAGRALARAAARWRR